MKTNFFTELKKLDLKQLSFSVFFKENTVSISVLPKSNSEDNATKLKPIVLRGTIEELDNLFFENLSTPLKDTAKFFSNIEEYQIQKSEKEKETQQAKDLKKEIKSLEEKLSKIVSEAEFNAEESKPKILIIVKDLLELSNNNTLANHWKLEIEKLTTATLF